MKNVFSKSLLCGVIASTFFLVNCNQGSSRKVTPNKAAPGADQGKTQPTATEQDLIASCNDEVQTLIKELNELTKKIQDDSKQQNLTDAQKQDLKQKSDEHSAKTNALIAKIAELKLSSAKPEDAKKKANGCELKNEKGEKSVIKNSQLKTDADNLAKDLAKNLKIASSRIGEISLEESNLSKNPVFTLKTSDITEFLANRNQNKYISDGKIQDGSNEQAKNLKDNKSACYVDFSSGEFTAKEKIKVKVTAHDKDGVVEGNNKIHKITLMEVGSDKSYQISCAISKNVSKITIDGEFLRVFNGHIGINLAKPEEAKEEKKEDNNKLEAKTEKKDEPKVEVKEEKKDEPKVEAKTEKKEEPKVEKKEEPKVEKKEEPKVEVKTEKKEEPKSDDKKDGTATAAEKAAATNPDIAKKDADKKVAAQKTQPKAKAQAQTLTAADAQNLARRIDAEKAAAAQATAQTQVDEETQRQLNEAGVQ